MLSSRTIRALLLFLLASLPTLVRADDKLSNLQTRTGAAECKRELADVSGYSTLELPQGMTWPLSSKGGAARRPEEIYRAGHEIQSAKDLKRVLSQKNGTYVFLIDEFGRLFVSHRFGDSIPPVGAPYLVTHRSLREEAFDTSPLGEDTEFIAAGELRVINSYGIKLTNKAGTFGKSNTKEHLILAQQIFLNFGLEVSRTLAMEDLSPETMTAANLDSDHLAEAEQARLYFKHMRDPKMRRLRAHIERTINELQDLLPNPAYPGYPELDPLTHLAYEYMTEPYSYPRSIDFFMSPEDRERALAWDPEGDELYPDPDLERARITFNTLTFTYIPYILDESPDFILQKFLEECPRYLAYHNNDIEAAIYELSDHLLYLARQIERQN